MIGTGITLWQPAIYKAVTAVIAVPAGGFELREDGSFELREDGTFELRE